MMATEMKTREHGLLFSGPMVRAVKDGKKSQTRRIPTRKNCESMPSWIWNRLEWDDAKVPAGAMQTFADDGYLHVACRPHASEPQDDPDFWTRERIYPRWSVGDRIWVKETFAPRSDLTLSKIQRPFYAADGDKLPPGYKWTPSIFMPRWASRLTLEITSIRVERLQDITEADALADGGWAYGTCPIHKAPERSFAELWDQLNGDKYPWESSPWIWVIGFRLLSGLPFGERGEG